MKKTFVPQNFTIPQRLDIRDLYLRMLTVHDVVKDYEAIMTSIDYLQKKKPFGPESSWPSETLTLEQDLIDLGWHQKEFQCRRSFAYTVMSSDDSRCLGCVYIDPSPHPDYDAEITLWVRKSEAEKGLDALLFTGVQQWVTDVWPFKNPGYPGRIIAWCDWQTEAV